MNIEMTLVAKKVAQGLVDAAEAAKKTKETVALGRNVKELSAVASDVTSAVKGDAATTTKTSHIYVLVIAALFALVLCGYGLHRLHKWYKGRSVAQLNNGQNPQANSVNKIVEEKFISVPNRDPLHDEQEPQIR